MQKCNTNKSNSINFKAKEIASNLKINDRVQKLDENKSYIKIKDHKRPNLRILQKARQ